MAGFRKVPPFDIVKPDLRVSSFRIDLPPEGITVHISVEGAVEDVELEASLTPEERHQRHLHVAAGQGARCLASVEVGAAVLEVRDVARILPALRSIRAGAGTGEVLVDGAVRDHHRAGNAVDPPAGTVDGVEADNGVGDRG